MNSRFAFVNKKILGRLLLDANERHVFQKFWSLMNGRSPAKTPQEYLKALPPERKKELTALHHLIRKHAPKLKPQMYTGMLGYGMYHYQYASGREGDWPIIGLASQKQYISLYVCVSDGKHYLAERYRRQFPRANIGKSCIRFKHLSDLDQSALAKFLREAAKKGGDMIAP